MNRRRLLILLTAVLALLPPALRGRRGRAQDGATPAASPAATPVAFVTVVLFDGQRRRVGTGTLTEAMTGQGTLSMTIEPASLDPGDYALVFHETGICDPLGNVPFTSAGGADPDGVAEAIGTLTVSGETVAPFETTIDSASLAALDDRDGSALLIHRVGAEGLGDLSSATERVACGVIYPPTESEPLAATPVAAPEATPEAAATPGTAAAEEMAAAEVTVEMVDIAFNPSEFTIPANTEVTVYLPNNGVTIHNFHIDALDVHSEDVPPGEETSVTINAEPGDYEYYCSIPGHREAGMVGTMRVE